MSNNEILKNKIKLLQEENEKLKLKLENIYNSTNPIQEPLQDDNKNDSLANAYAFNKIGYWNYSYQKKTFTCSDEIKQLLEIPADQDFSNFDHLKKFIHPTEFKKIIEFNKQLDSAVGNIEFVFQTILHDGSSRFINIKARAKKDESGKKTSIFGTATDITELHFTTEKLKQNENLFKSLFLNLTDIFIIFELVKDKNNNVIDYVYKEINPAYEMKFNLTRSEIINRKLSAQTQIFQQFHPILKITAQTEQAQQDRFFIQSLDSFHDVLIYSPLKNHIATIWRDVNLMVNTESSLRESEEKYRQFFSLGSDGLIMIDLISGKIIDANPSICKMIDSSKSELLGNSFKQIIDDSDLFEKNIKSNKLNNINGNLKKQNGALIPIEGSLSYFNWGGHKVVFISVRDISTRIAAQNELIISEKRFKQLFNYSNDAILILNDHKIIDNNKKATQLFGIETNELINYTLWNLSPSLQLNGDDSRLRIVEKTQEAIQGKQLHFNWQFLKNDNKIFYADIKLSPIFFEDQKVLQVIVRDITPQKTLENELSKKEARWKYSLETSSIGIWEWNLITNNVYFSSEWKKIIGYKKEEIENNFEEFEKRIHPDDIANVYNQIESYISKTTNEYNIIFRLRCKNGSYKWINAKGKIYSYTPDSKAERFIGTHTDITKHIVEKQMLLASKQKYEKASKILNMGYWELNIKSMLLSGPKETFEIFGLDTEQATLKQIEELIHPEDQVSFRSQFINKHTNEFSSYTFRILVNAQVKYIISYTEKVIDIKNRIEGFSGVFQDISIFKEEELQIKDNQTLINSFIEKTQQAILIVQNQDIIYKNDKFKELTGYDLINNSKNEIPFLNIILPDDKASLLLKFENVTLNNTSKEKIIVRIETKHKRIKWVEVFISLLKFKGSNAVLYSLSDFTSQKTNELTLKEREKSFNEITSNSPAGIAHFDLSDKFIYLNSEFENLTGSGQNQINKSTLKQLFSESDYYNIHNAIEEIKRQNIDEYQNEVILNNQIWIRLKIVPLFDNEKVSSFVMYIENIDIVKRQIDLLTEDNILHHSILTNSSAGIGFFNQNGHLLLHNESFLKNINLDTPLKSDVIFDDLYISINNNPLLFDELLKLNESLIFEHSINENKTIFFEIKTIDLISSTGILIITKDITETKKQSFEMANRLQKFYSIFEQMPLGIALIDSERKIIICNNKYAEILAYHKDELLKMKLDQLIKTESLPEIITKLSELFSGVTPSFNQLNQIANKQSEKIWISSTFTQFTDKFNEVSYAIQLIEDVSKSKSDEYNSINQERLQTLNYIANNFAHVFNNLLMSIYGNSYLLKSNITDENLTVYADNLLKTLHSASEQTHKLLSFAKKSSKINLLINIPELIEEIIEENKFKHNIQIDTSFDYKTGITLGDPSQLQRVFQIIIENAKDAMPNGGELTFETKSVYFENSNENNLSELNKGKYLRISISDSGKGINPDIFHQIFDPFYSNKKDSFHSGLGLTIAQKIINEHKGLIKAESHLNKGSEFNIYLPQFDDEYIHNSIQPDEQLIVKGTANLMIVDDEEIVRLVTAELLKKLGYNVFSFSSGKKSIQFYKENMQNIDLVVLDKHMPEMDGIEAYKNLKKLNPSINVILLTGYNIDSEIEAVFNNSNSSIIQKPVSIEKLSNSISNLLVKNN